MYHSFRKQVGQRGCYAGISLHIETQTGAVPGMYFQFTDPDLQWKTACEAGAKIFYDYYKWKAYGTLNITIERIDWLPADTNHLIVLYATISALCEALQIEIPEFSFQKETALFVFPECRNLINT